MNVLVFTQFFPPEACAASSRTAAVCRGFAQAGHRVTVVTGFPNFPTGRIAPGYRRKIYSRESIGGLSVLRVWTYASPRARGAGRLLNWISVACGALLATPLLVLRARPAAVFVTCPPVTLAAPALLAAWLTRARLLVDVRDAYPDVAVKMGVWKADAPVTRIVGRIVRILYRRAYAISCVTESVREEVAQRADVASKTFLAKNGFDAVEARDAAVFERRPDDFVVAFAGNIGLAAGLDVLLSAASRLRSNPRVRFKIAGDGADFARISDRVRNEGLINVEMLGALDRRGAMAVLRDADLCAVPLRSGISDSLPTKIFDALYAGCPVLLSGDGEAAAFLERSGGGWHVPAEDGAALAGQIEELSQRRALCRSAGAAGRDYVVRSADRSEGVSRIISAAERSSATIANNTQAYL